MLDLAAYDLGADVMPIWACRKSCTVVLDNASAHVAKAFKGRRRQLAKIGVELFYLPPYSPELNDIELVWRQAKYPDYPQRAQTSTEAIGAAVDRAMRRQRDRIRQATPDFIQAASLSAQPHAVPPVVSVGGTAMSVPRPRNGPELARLYGRT
ncbi:transposase [Streptomyces sp. NPDC047461]|uniref:transposase n=1 Tax=Streptomyces sp. NPDC047461 TaxID=3155619 RepID=UPI0033EB19AA